MLSLIIVSGVACGDDDGRGTSASTTSTASVQTCVAPTFRLEYPASWHANDSNAATACSWFHPEPFELPEATEAVGVAAHVGYGSQPLDGLVDAVGGDVIDRRSELVDGRDAVRLHHRVTADALLREGTEAVTRLVDMGPGALVASTTDAASAGRFASNTAVLDDMMRSVELSADFACSAAGHHLRVEESGAVPGPVDVTRSRLLDAAVSCDFAGLSRAAEAGDQAFTFSFGADEDPGEYWRELERRGEEPLRLLARLLELRHAIRPAGPEQHYVWPAAYAADSWSAVTEAQRADLRRLYGPATIDSFEAAGAYLGHRVGIAGSGEWLFYVAGD